MGVFLGRGAMPGRMGKFTKILSHGEQMVLKQTDHEPDTNFENGVYFYRHLLSPAPLPFSLSFSLALTLPEREKEREGGRMREVGRGGGREGEMERAFWVYALYFYRHLLHHSKLQGTLFKR